MRFPVSISAPVLAVFFVACLHLALPAVAQGPSDLPVAELERLFDDHARLRGEGVGDADEILIRAEDLAATFESAEEDSMAAVALNISADLYLNNRRFEDAQDTYRRCLELVMRAGLASEEATIRSNLAVSYGMQGDFESLIAQSAPLIDLARELEDVTLEQRCWFNIGVSYTQLGRIPEASSAIQKSLELVGTLDRPGSLVSCLVMASELNMQMQRWDMAKVFTDSAVALGRDAAAALPFSASLLGQATLRSREGDIEGALASIDEAIAVRKAAGYDLYVPIALLVRIRLQVYEDRAAEALLSLDELDALIEGSDDPTLTMDSRLWRAMAQLELGQDAEGTLRELMEDYETQIAELEDDASAGGYFKLGGEAYASLARIHVQRGEMEEAWNLIERGSAPRLRRRLGRPEPASIVAVQEALREQNALLLHFSDTSKMPTQIFALDGFGVKYIELEHADDLELKTGAALNLLEGSEDTQALEDVLVPLAQTLLGELAPTLDADTLPQRRIIIVTPSVLAGFPFEALPVGSRGERLGEAFAVSYLPAASLVTGYESPSESGRLLAFADPSLGESSEVLPAGITSSLREARTTPLPYAREEVEVFGGEQADVLIGADASKQQLLTRLDPSPAVLHFATHAIVSAPSPENSCLLLAGEDGMLRSGEVEELELETDLVTLSACQTNGGYIYMGEGVFSLSRSFLRAGARTVVSSLWNVEDRSTALLMREFYRALGEGAERDEALRQARVAAGKAGISLRDRSAFVMTGAGALSVPALVGQVETESDGGMPPALVGVAGVLLLLAVLALRARRA